MKISGDRVAATNNVFSAISDADSYLTVGSFGRALALGQKIEDVAGNPREPRFRDVDIINYRRPLYPYPSFYILPSGVKIDTILARNLRPLGENDANWGVFDHRLLRMVSTFCADDLGIVPREFSRDSEQTVETPDACAFILMNRIFTRLMGSRAIKHQQQYAELEERRRELCSGGNHGGLEKSVREVEKTEVNLPRRRHVKVALGRVAPHLTQFLLDNTVSSAIYHRVLRVPVIQPQEVSDLQDLLR